MTSLPLDPDDWLVALRSNGAERDAAERRLHELLVRAAHAEARRRGH